MRGTYAGSREERERDRKKIYLVCKDPSHAAQGPEKKKGLLRGKRLGWTPGRGDKRLMRLKTVWGHDDFGCSGQGYDVQ